MRSIHTNTLLHECFEAGYAIHLYDGERIVIAQNYKDALNHLDSGAGTFEIRLVTPTDVNQVGYFTINLNLSEAVQVTDFSDNAITRDIFNGVLQRQNQTAERGALIYG